MPSHSSSASTSYMPSALLSALPGTAMQTRLVDVQVVLAGRGLGRAYAVHASGSASAAAR